MLVSVLLGDVISADARPHLRGAVVPDAMSALRIKPKSHPQDVGFAAAISNGRLMAEAVHKRFSGAVRHQEQVSADVANLGRASVWRPDTDRLDSENRSPPIRVLKQAHEGLKRWLLA